MEEKCFTVHFWEEGMHAELWKLQINKDDETDNDIMGKSSGIHNEE